MKSQNQASLEGQERETDDDREVQVCRLRVQTEDSRAEETDLVPKGCRGTEEAKVSCEPAFASGRAGDDSRPK